MTPFVGAGHILLRSSTVTNKYQVRGWWQGLPVCGTDDKDILLGAHAVHLGQQLVDDTVSCTTCNETVHMYLHDSTIHRFSPPTKASIFNSITIKQSDFSFESLKALHLNT